MRRTAVQLLKNHFLAIPRYLFKIVQLARRKIQLITFLEIFYKVQNSYNSQSSDVFRIKAPITCEQEVQTELHPVPSNIDRQYRWNIWDLRREAIELTNMRMKRTSSCQTTKAKLTQVYPPKVQGTQTRVSRGTETEERRPRLKKTETPPAPSPLEVYSLTVESLSASSTRRSK